MDLDVRVRRGGRLLRVTNPAAGATGQGDSTLSYNARNQLTERDDPVAGLHVELSWDANGNVLTQVDASGERSFRYDARDRLLTLAQPNAPPLAFDYQSDGLRLAKRHGAAETRYQYDQQALIAETNAIGNTLTRYHYGATQLVSRTEAGSPQSHRHYLLDALKTPIALLTQQGAVSARTRYDAWGAILAQQAPSGTVTSPNPDGTHANLADTDQQPIGFTGYLKDTESGLYYAKARYYDPRIARFTSEDPERGDSLQPPSLHRYLYAYQRPRIVAAGHDSVQLASGVTDPRPSVKRCLPTPTLPMSATMEEETKRGQRLTTAGIRIRRWACKPRTMRTVSRPAN